MLRFQATRLTDVCCRTPEDQFWFAQQEFYAPLFFKVPPGSCKGRESVTCLLQASEYPSGRKILWGDARKQHSPEQVEPPHFTECFGEGGETRDQLLPKTWPQDVAANKARSTAQAGFLRGSRSLTDDEIVFFNGFSRRRDKKVSSVLWKFICLHFQSALLLHFSKLAEMQQDPSTLHSFQFQVSCAPVQYSPVMIKSCQTSAVFTLQTFTYFYTANETLRLMSITRKQFVWSRSSLVLGSSYWHLREMHGGLWLLQQTLCLFSKFYTALISHYLLHSLPTVIMSLNKKHLVLCWETGCIKVA